MFSDYDLLTNPSDPSWRVAQTDNLCVANINQIAYVNVALILRRCLRNIKKFMYSSFDPELGSKQFKHRGFCLFGWRFATLSCGLMLAMAPALVMSAELDVPIVLSANAPSRAPDFAHSEANQLAVIQAPTNEQAGTQILSTQEPVTEAVTLTAELLIPVVGISYSELQDTFSKGRSTGRIHGAIDIMARKGTPIVAVVDGTIAHLCKRGRGGLSIYLFDENKNFVYFYAHLNSYSPLLFEGKKIKRGEIIGYVGHTGNARVSAPHLHFAMASIGSEKNWWSGDAINPYPLFQK